MGLFIGASLYTVFEIIALALNSFGVCLKSNFNKKIEHGVEKSEISNRIEILEKKCTYAGWVMEKGASRFRKLSIQIPHGIDDRCCK